MITLYKRHSSGTIGTWTIWSQGHTIYMETRLTPDSDGTIRTEEVPYGKAGRTLGEQIESRINARVRAKLDSGYKENEGALRATVTNQLELPAPMLAVTNTKSLMNAREVYVQPKLDGMRMIVTRQHGKLVAYSRKGKLIETLPHIMASLENLIPEGAYWDGEIYRHGLTLQQIMSLAKRPQTGSEKLQYHVFDVIEDTPFSERFEATRYIGDPHAIVRVDTRLLRDAESLPVIMQQARRQGYEGLILRNGSATYEPGKRSPHIVKVKEFMDSEFEVVDWDVSQRGVPVLLCRTLDGAPFRVTAPGTHEDRANAPNLVGKFVTVKYAYMTADGIPFQPICVGERDDL
jgi:ATP-dependent DNA ligase